MNARHLMHLGLKALKREAPTLQTVIGVSLMFAAGGILVSFADDISEVNQKVRDAKEEIKLADTDPVGWDDMGETRKQYVRRTRKEIAVGYLKTVGPAAGVAVLGAVSIYKGHLTLETRLKDTTASLAALALFTSNYRNRVRADLGEEKDMEYATGYSVDRKTIVDGETGETTEEVKIVKKDGDSSPRNGFVFKEGYNPNWSKSPAVNYNFLMNSLDAVNFQLSTREEMSLNEMLKPFGEKHRKYGQNAGAFKYDKDGSINHIRLNPVFMQGLINGTSPDAICVLEYDDGRPLETDILNDVRNIWNEE